jgi:glycosyltransferase involved in cell wall biosynthesis
MAGYRQGSVRRIPALYANPAAAGSMMHILYVAYPLLAVSENSAGGAEQMLTALEGEMAARGHRVAVAASERSRVAGQLVATGPAATGVDEYDAREAEHSRRILEHLRAVSGDGHRYHLVHDKSGSFWRHAAGLSLPVLATLHLPRSFYRAEWFANLPANLFFNCVSREQARTFRELPQLAGVVQNGIAVGRFPLQRKKERYLLWMGRICEEKGPHVAIEVARLTGRPLILAGQIYPFSYHRQYYENCVRPHVDGVRVTVVDSPGFVQKAELLSHAHALLAPSLCDETSSLVSMEAMACGTPVVAFRRGGIPEVVAHGETGFVVDTPAQMATAVEHAGSIDPIACRRRVEAHFTVARMAGEYEKLYERIVGSLMIGPTICDL